MPNWVLAPSLKKLRYEITSAFPNRSTASDGSIGDTSHSARTSDHNPNIAGVVTAIDVTNDPASGCTGERLAAALIKSKDRRIKYLIFNKRMIRSYPANGKPAWTWQPYNGANAHQHHIHISVAAEKALYDSTEVWNLDLDIATVKDEEIDEPDTAPLVEDSTTAPTETSVTVTDGNVKVETSEGAKPQEKIAIEKPMPLNFSTTMRNKIATVTGGNLTLQAVRDYAEQARFLGLSMKFWFWVSLIALIGTAIYLISAFYKHRSDVRRDMEITNTLITANSTPSNLVELVDKEKLSEYKSKGYKIISR